MLPMLSIFALTILFLCLIALCEYPNTIRGCLAVLIPLAITDALAVWLYKPHGGTKADIFLLFVVIALTLACIVCIGRGVLIFAEKRK